MTTVPKVDVVGVGLNATDTMIPVKDFPAGGSKVEIPEVTTMLGGQVASAVAACQYWGLRARYVGKLGEDYFATLHGVEFARLEVETHFLTAPGCSSQQAYILVDHTGERTVLWKRDKRLTLLPEELQRDWIVNARVLHLDGHDTAAATLAAKWAREAGVAVVADLDELYPGIEQLLPNIDYLITSRDLPEKLAAKKDLRTALREVFARFGCRLTAATLGSDGVLAWDGKRFHYAAAFQVNAVDTTGAGDTFHAGFIYAWRMGWPLQRQLEFASAAAALNCTGFGARGAIQPVEKIAELMSKGKRHRAAFEVEASE